MGPAGHFGALKLHFVTKLQSRIGGKEGILRNSSREELRPTLFPLVSNTGEEQKGKIHPYCGFRPAKGVQMGTAGGGGGGRFKKNN